MAFRFALAPLLRLRQSIERQHTLQLQDANLRVSRVQETLAQLERFLADSAESDSAAISTGSTAAELQFASHYRENLDRYRKELLLELSQVKLLRQKALAEYHSAYREREVIEALRLRHRRDYEQDQQRKRQQELDAAHLLRRWYRRD